MNFTVRNAELRDIENVYNLSNDTDVRRMSINKDKIEWENHVKWFNRRINEVLPFYIIESESGEFIGQVRFEEYNAEIFISISLVKIFRSQGLGQKIIEYCAKKSGFSKINAYIYDNNIASIKAFQHANFNNTRLLKYVYLK